MIYHTSITSPIGKLLLIEEDNKLTHVLFLNRERKENKGEEKETPLFKETKKQLEEYFGGKRKIFNLPLKFKGKPFQEQCWRALQKIPYGETRSYKEQAESIKNPKAIRAAGGANNKNPLLIIIPCHRVIGKNGKLVGYDGGMSSKEFLLNLEKKKLT